jgi:hypothetical protein
MEHESGTENTVPKIRPGWIVDARFRWIPKQLILTKTMILNFDQLNNQLYLLEKEFQEFISGKGQYWTQWRIILIYFIVRTIRLYTYTIRDCRKSLDGEEGFIPPLENVKADKL